MAEPPFEELDDTIWITRVVDRHLQEYVATESFSLVSRKDHFPLVNQHRAGFGHP